MYLTRKKGGKVKLFKRVAASTGDKGTRSLRGWRAGPRKGKGGAAAADCLRLNLSIAFPHFTSWRKPVLMLLVWEG